MRLALEDVLKVNVVLLGVHLLDDPNKLSTFKSVVGVEAIEAAPTVQMGSAQIGLGPQVIVFPKERTLLELAPTRSAISREYPNHQELERLAAIACWAIEESIITQPAMAYGFNMDSVYKLPASQTASRFIADHIFARDLFPFHSIDGGVATLQLHGGSDQWSLRMEPRFNERDTDRLFISLNLHFDEPSIPSKEAIRSGLEKLWCEGQSIMGGFTGGEG